MPGNAHEFFTFSVKVSSIQNLRSTLIDVYVYLGCVEGETMISGAAVSPLPAVQGLKEFTENGNLFML